MKRIADLSSRFQSEVELARAVAGWAEAEGWEVFKEVHTGEGDADLVLCQGRVLWIVETKLALSDKLLEQAARRLGYAHYVSVAVPQLKGDLSAPRQEFLERWGLGLVEVTHPDRRRILVERLAGGAARFREGPERDVNWAMVASETIRARVLRPAAWDPRGYSDRDSPRLIRAERMARLRASLRPEHKLLIAGAAGGGQLTPWKATLLELKALLAKGPLPLAAIVAGVDHHYRSPRAARAGIHRMLAELDCASFIERKQPNGPSSWGLAPKAAMKPKGVET